MNQNDDVPVPFLTIDLPDERTTAAFAEDIAACLARGDVVGLSGGLGAGKTTFARALLRALAGDTALDVPSPTFTLVQTYAAGRLPVAHIDLYRLSGPHDLDEIGFADAAEEGAVLVEWPERAGDRLPADRLTIAFEIVGAGRRAIVSGRGDLAARVERSRRVRAFLQLSGWQDAARRRVAGDASARIYERIAAGPRRSVLMDWPPSGQLPPGDPRIGYRARDVRAFVAVDRALRDAGLSAPEIYAADLSSGFVLMEDLGAEGLIVDGAPDLRRYRLAVETLAEIHRLPRPSELQLPDGQIHRLPPLGREALAVEVATFVDSYVPYATGRPLAEAARSEFANLWIALIDRLAAAEQSWVLFDVQSSNLFWLPDRRGLARLGIVDFQDMFFGPSAYDVASLCQDARITVPAALESELKGHYVSLRRARAPAFDADSFHIAYAISAALRAIKNLGVFARFAAVGNINYINHIPRLREYLAGTLAHPVLSSLAVWYEKHLPR